MSTSPTLWRNAFFASTTALVASGALWIARPTPTAPPAPSPPAPASALATSQAPAPPGPADTCCAALDKCRAENWSALVKTITGDAVRGLDAGVAAATAEVRSNTGAEAQQQALDEIARALLRQQLVQAQPLLYWLMQDMGTEAWGKQWTVDEINRIDPELHLDATSRRRLSDGFESLWASRGADFQRALKDNPPNGRALHEAMKDFFRAQDDLVEHVLGDEAREKYRALELGSRSAVAAISATLADAPWDDSIVW